MEFINLDHLYKSQVVIEAVAKESFDIYINDPDIKSSVTNLVKSSLNKYGIVTIAMNNCLYVHVGKKGKRLELMQTIADYLTEKRGLSVDLVRHTDPVIEDLLNNFVPIPGIDTEFNKYQVTQEQWRVVSKLPKVNIDLYPDPSHFKGDKLPVESVTVKEVKEFCNRLSNLDTTKKYALPRASEWLVALSDETDPTTTTANVNDCLRKTSIVGSYKANINGLYDMYGNVKEICKGKEGYVAMGGSWLEKPEYHRTDFIPVIPYITIGFRVVCKNKADA